MMLAVFQPVLKPVLSQGRKIISLSLATMAAISLSQVAHALPEQSQMAEPNVWQVRDALASSLAQTGLLDLNHQYAMHDHGNTHGIGGGDSESIDLLASNDALADKINELSERVQQREDRLADLSSSITQQKKAEQSRHILALMPVANATVTSNYGPRSMYGRSFHKGIDLAVPTGTPVYATGDGVVVHAGYSRSYGRWIKVKHADGYETRYAHNSSLRVKTGDTITQNQHIANVGCTGQCTGPHLHYEVRKNGKATNPNVFLAMAPAR